MKRKLNSKLLLGVSLGIVFFAVFVSLLHGYQMRGNGRVLLEQASRAQEEGDLERAADHLQRYLGYQPADTAVLQRYALLLADEKLAATPRARVRALEVLEQVL